MCKICQDIINIIFTSQGEAINNDMVLNWLKNKKQFDIINDKKANFTNAQFDYTRCCCCPKKAHLSVTSCDSLLQIVYNRATAVTEHRDNV